MNHLPNPDGPIEAPEINRILRGANDKESDAMDDTADKPKEAHTILKIGI